MKVYLNRTDSTDYGTFGVITLNGKELCKTCERPWRDNKPQISCIPTGTYECRAYSSRKFPDVWEILNVPNRSAILIHAGNVPSDLRGCIAPGTSFGMIDGKKAVLGSRDALNKLRKTLPDKFTITII